LGAKTRVREWVKELDQHTAKTKRRFVIKSLLTLREIAQQHRANNRNHNAQHCMIRKMLRLATLLVSRFRTRYNSVGEFDQNKYQSHNLYNFPAGHRHCICPVYMANMHHFPLNFGDILLGMTYKKLGRRLRKLGTFLGHKVYNLIHIFQHHNFDMWHFQDPGRFFQ
jgi:hypothetical protein